MELERPKIKVSGKIKFSKNSLLSRIKFRNAND